MTEPKDFTLSPELHRYVLDHSVPLDQVQRDLIAATEALGPVARMQIAPEQGAFMTLLTTALRATTVVEVGTFTGYSTLALARGLAPGGRVLACDVSDEWTRLGRAAWEAAGVADRIDLRIGPALETLAALPTERHIDLAFVDADKGNYEAYLAELIPRVVPDGVILVDNVLWSCAVVDAAVTDADTEAIRACNRALAADPRVDVVILPISDGVSFVRVR